ncbi:putative disrupter of telomere silencing protein Dot5 [Chaetomium sp. MPI-CAGE-AT-0009]|nr:putative disrupter of telomere silencing protein Dot5 [Chaetomium sp. MPI-CAGE-AT-0009]
MPMELRKRKEAPAPPPAPARKKTTKTAKAASAATKVKDAVKEKVAPVVASTNGSSDSAKPAVGDTINLDGFGGEIETNEGTKTTLKALVDESKAGVAIFTYPKASTPGCTKQACLFRDAYAELSTASGLALYGLSADSPKANTTFRTKQRLPYPLLCDPQATLIAAVGLQKAPRGTTRGVFVVDKEGKVLAAQAGGPDKTVDVVREVVERLGEGAADEGKEEEGEEGVSKPEAETETEKEEEAKEEANGNGEAKGEEEKENGKEEEAKEEANGEGEKKEE